MKKRKNLKCLTCAGFNWLRKAAKIEIQSLFPDFLFPMTMMGFQSGLSGSWLTWSRMFFRFFDVVLTSCGDTMNLRNSPKSHTSPICDWHWLWTVRWHQQHFKSTIPGPSPQTSSQTSHSECKGRFPGIQWCRNFCSLGSTETVLQMWVALAFLMQVAWTQHPMPQLEQNWPKSK